MNWISRFSATLLSGVDKTVSQNQMHSRQSAAEVVRVRRRIEGVDTNSIDTTFERWELTLIKTKISAGASSAFVESNELDAQYINATEKQHAFEDELNKAKG